MSEDRKQPSPRPCPICGSANWTVAFEGRVRQGTFGHSRAGTVYRCPSCGVEHLPSDQADLEEYYRSEAYRKEVDRGADVEQYFTLHDSEQFGKLALLESIPIRGKVVADVGSGAGSFLDGLSGFAARTIAIEPMAGYHASLKERGHLPFPFTRDALEQWAGKVDLVTCFSVIEHVEDPLALVQEMGRLLSPTGQLLLSTPNRDDVLLRIGLEPYREFFYRAVHLFYFDSGSLLRLLEKAGLYRSSLVYRHRFGFTNFLNWVRHAKPTGNPVPPALDHEFDLQWRRELERRGWSDYLYVTASR